MNGVPEFVLQLLSGWPQWMQAIAYYGVVAVVLFITVILCMAFLTLLERRVIGSIQARIGPNRVGPGGIGQPFADVLKLLVKEIVIPSSSSKFLFVLAPLLALIPALCTWAVVPLWPGFTVANVNAGLLYILALTSTGVYGIILAGWAANSKYALLGAMRGAAQMIAYEIAMGFALVGVVMAAG
jgi:NADH-quinone oxidoreductase subunit H